MSHLYDPWHPAVLELLQRRLRAPAQPGKAVEVCGEMAGDPAFTELLLAMGLRSFSMHPARISAVKQRVLRADTRLLAWSGCSQPSGRRGCLARRPIGGAGGSCAARQAQPGPIERAKLARERRQARRREGGLQKTPLHLPSNACYSHRLRLYRLRGWAANEPTPRRSSQRRGTAKTMEAAGGA